MRLYSYQISAGEEGIESRHRNIKARNLHEALDHAIQFLHEELPKDPARFRVCSARVLYPNGSVSHQALKYYE